MILENWGVKLRNEMLQNSETKADVPYDVKKIYIMIIQTRL
jgi:hypothetical protein